MRVAKIALHQEPCAIGRKLKFMSRRGCDRFSTGGEGAKAVPPKPGENVAEIIAAFQHPVQTAQRGLDEREMRRKPAGPQLFLRTSRVDKPSKPHFSVLPLTGPRCGSGRIVIRSSPAPSSALGVV